MIPRNTPTLTTEAPVIQYSCGHTKSRAPGIGRFLPFAGFYSEVNKDAQFDAACTAAKIPQIEVKHGSGNIVLHWAFGEELRIYPITAGPVARTIAASLSNGLARRTAEAGIGLRWGTGERSKLAIRGLLNALLPDYTEVVQLSVRSHQTDALLAALLDHVR